MHRQIMQLGAAALFVAGATSLLASTAEQFRNDKVIVSEVTLAPGEHEALPGHDPSIVVCLAGERAEIRFAGGGVQHESIARGETLKEPAKPGTLFNTGQSPLKLVRVEFLAPGKAEIWGRAGLPSNYQMIYDDTHSRVYSIRIAPKEWEPMHTHHARVVVCLSGAKLEHVLPDGSIQPSTLQTDEVTWRQGQTHKGHNIGDTALWAIAIEPK